MRIGDVAAGMGTGLCFSGSIPSIRRTDVSSMRAGLMGGPPAASSCCKICSARGCSRAGPNKSAAFRVARFPLGTFQTLFYGSRCGGDATHIWRIVGVSASRRQRRAARRKNRRDALLPWRIGQGVPAAYVRRAIFRHRSTTRKGTRAFAPYQKARYAARALITLAAGMCVPFHAMLRFCGAWACASARTRHAAGMASHSALASRRHQRVEQNSAASCAPLAPYQRHRAA